MPTTPSDAAGAGRRPGVSVAEVDRIAALDDPVLRNLLITQSYYELSHALARRLGPSANWPTFGVWASKQAGQTIRQQDLSRIFERYVGGSNGVSEAFDGVVRTLLARTWQRDGSQVERVLREALHPQAAFDRASAAVARGNLKVFAEIGREIARFLEDLGGDTELDEARLEAFCADLAPGEPPRGQDHLRAAFHSLYRAFFDTDDQRRAERLLHASLEIGFHEQTRLQPEIEASIEAPVVDAAELRRRVLTKLFRRLGPLRVLLRLYLSWTTPIDGFWRDLTAVARRHAHHAVTDLLMTLELPGEVLRLGEDLRSAFPPSLQRLTLPELTAVLARLDPTPDSPRDSGAVDWADFADRMHFIGDFFRAYQERQELLGPPFTAEQVAEIRQGRVPEGRL